MNSVNLDQKGVMNFLKVYILSTNNPTMESSTIIP
jgi:hypothetical protein